MSLSSAKSRVMFARENMDNGRADSVSPMLDAAEGFLEGLPDDEAAPVRAQIAEIRGEMASRMSPDDERMISAARGKLKQTQGWVEMGYSRAEVEENLGRAAEFLADVPEVHKGPVLAEIAAFRAQLDGGTSAPEPVTTPIPIANTSVAMGADPTDEEYRSISRAKTSIMWARENNDDGKLSEALGYLAGVRDEHKAALLTQIEEVRAAIGGATLAEEIRDATRFLDMRFEGADDGNAGSLAYCFGRLGSEELRRLLPADLMEQYQARLAAAFGNRTARLKANALDGAGSIVRDIESHLVTDLFVGLSEGDVNGIISECEHLKSRVRSEIRSATYIDTYSVWAEERDPVTPGDREAVNAKLVVAENDADFRALYARIEAFDREIAQALDRWKKARLDARIAEDWRQLTDEVEGWQQESVNPDARPFTRPDMSKTRLAIGRIRYLLDDPQTAQVRATYPDDPAIQGQYRAAENLFDAVAAKLVAAYNEVLDAADALPTPEPELTFDLAAPGMLLESDAQLSSHGTTFLAPVMARLAAIDERWQADVAAVLQAREELGKKLAAEGDAVWPAIVAATGATTDFDPTDADSRGMTVLLSRVRNRAGWTFNGCDFGMRLDGTPNGGNYEPHVRRALEHARYELKLEVSDWIDWDLVGVVEGPGKMGERTNRVVRDASTNKEIGRIEEWPPIDCVWLRIIALHAGPVAVGPAQ